MKFTGLLARLSSISVFLFLTSTFLTIGFSIQRFNDLLLMSVIVLLSVNVGLGFKFDFSSIPAIKFVFFLMVASGVLTLITNQLQSSLSLTFTTSIFIILGANLILRITNTHIKNLQTQ